MNTNRRTVLKGLAAAALPALGGNLSASPYLPYPNPNKTVDEIARDELFWSEVRTYYDPTKGITNLEHGYWGKMARPVLEFFVEATRITNAQNSYYARKEFDNDADRSRQRIAQALGVHDDEIVITRNATEAIHNLLRQYKGLGKGDAVLYADIDYPNFKKTTDWIARDRGARPVEVKIPSRANAVLEWK